MRVDCWECYIFLYFSIRSKWEKMVWKLRWLNCIPTYHRSHRLFFMPLVGLNLLFRNDRNGGKVISMLVVVIFYSEKIQKAGVHFWWEEESEKLKCCRQETDRSIQKMFALWCFPAWFSQASSADLSCGEQHTMLLCPEGLHHSTTPHNSSLWSQKLPRPQLPVPKYCPLLSTHILSPALVAQPEATNS